MNSFYKPLTPLRPLPDRQLDDMVEALCDGDDQRHFAFNDEAQCLGDYPWEDTESSVN